MILVLDNYDSFTFNLVQYLRELGAAVRVVSNDELDPAQILALDPAGIVVSPGPGTPRRAGISIALIRAAAGSIPLLGVCLGHQCLAVAFGARVIPARTLMHGKVDRIHHRGQGLFHGLPDPFRATRYHSLAVQASSLPDELEVTAWSEDGEIMGLRHRQLALEGVQFHPESLLSEHGHAMLGAFLDSSCSGVSRSW